MGYSLVIVESPAKTGSFEKILGAGYKCMASFGHIRELKGLKDIDRENGYKPSFSVSASKLKQVKKLKDAAAKADTVYLATDDDREGEAIAWHLCQVLHLDVSSTPRMIFHEITPTAIMNAVRNPSLIDMSKVQAQQARQILDILVGFQISPLLWKQFGGQLALSAGRCQTPALRLVYENEIECEKSPGQVIYTTTGFFTPKTICFTLNHQHDSEDAVASFLETTVNSEFQHMLSLEKEGTSTKSAPKPFTTSSMQQSANTELHISPKEAMSICQKLYEAGLITYMRTDSRTYSKDFVESTKTFITANYGAQYISPSIDSLTGRTVDAKSKGKGKGKGKGDATEKKSTAQEAHEAIRPTKITTKGLSPEKFSPKDRRMYAMIWRNSLESCMKDCKCATVTAVITAPDALQYRNTEEQVIEPGWKIVNGFDDNNVSYRYLVGLKSACPMKVSYSKINSKLGMKDSKGRLTEARLVHLLEEKGIGRPSTFSSLIDKIQERGYVKRDDIVGKEHKGVEFELVGDELTEIEVTKKFGGEKNKLLLQPIGRLAWEFLQEHCLPLFEYEFTKSMEANLDEIATGSRVWNELCRECDGDIATYTSQVVAGDAQVVGSDGTAKSKGFNPRDIRIDDEHVYTITKYGPAVLSVVNGKKTYQTARKDIDLSKLRKGELCLDDVIDESKKEGGIVLGEYNGHRIILKNGKFGYYVTYGEKNVSVKKLGKKESAITLQRVIPLLDAAGEEKKFRELNKDFSVRVGKTPYVFYKTAHMKKPKFLNLKGFDEDPFECDENILWAWLRVHHKIENS